MKKIIAMLLAVALIASLGALAFADPKWSNADSSVFFGDQADKAADEASTQGKVKNFAGQVENEWKDYLKSIVGVTDAAKLAELKEIFQDVLDMYAEDNADNNYGLDASIFTAVDTPADCLAPIEAAQKAAKDAGAAKTAAEKDAAIDSYKENYYAKKAEADKAKAADKAAKTAAYNAYLASDRTALDLAVYDVAVANVDAQRALANAKAAVADAKAEFARAQNTWKDTVNVKVAEAQAEYYVAVAAAYSDAVSEAVAAIYDALG